MPLGPADQEKVLLGVTQALTRGDAMPDGPAAQALADPKAAFCNAWPTVVPVLTVLKDIVPVPANAIIGLVIALGNGVKSNLCG